MAEQRGPRESERARRPTNASRRVRSQGGSGRTRGEATTLPYSSMPSATLRAFTTPKSPAFFAGSSSA